MDAIDKIKKEREMTLETKVEDRELTVLKFMSANTNLRQVNMFLAARDKKEEEKKQQETTQDEGLGEQIITSSKPAHGVTIGSKYDITDEDDVAAAVKLMADNEKNSKFRDKRSIELEKVMK